jgi:hypothetical protein
MGFLDSLTASFLPKDPVDHILKKLADDLYLDAKTSIIPELDTGKNVNERINTWIEAQARLFWHIKKNPNQTNKEQKDDYHNAKRYFAFIIAYNAINDCRKSSACPLYKLTNTHIDYLECLTVYEFVLLDAFLAYLSNDNRSKYSSTHLEDYFNATNLVDSSLCGRFTNQIPPTLEHWHELLIKREPLPKEKKKEVKKVALARNSLDNDKNLEMLDYYLLEVYENLRDIILNPESCMPDQINQLSQILMLHIYKYPHNVNMFEYMLKCVFSSIIDPDNHNLIRSCCNKKPIDALPSSFPAQCPYNSAS